MHQYDKALRSIGRARARIRGGLGGVRAAASLDARLTAYESLIGDTLIGNYSSAALSYALVGVPSEASTLPQVDAPPVSIGLEAFLLGAFPSMSSTGGGALDAQSLAAGSAPLSSTVGDDSLLVAEVLPLLASLLRARRLDAAMEAFQSRFLAGLPAMFESEVAEAVRTVSDEGGGSMELPASAPAAAALDCVLPLGPDAFIAVASSVSHACVDMLRRVQALHDMVERSLNSHEAAAAAAATGGGGSDDAETVQAASDAVTLRALSSGVMAVCVEAVQVRGRARRWRRGVTL